MPKFLDVTDKSAAKLALGLPETVTPVKTAAYTTTVGETVRCDATAGGFTVTLPAAPAKGSQVNIRKIDTTTNTVTVQRSGSDVFNVSNGVTSLQLMTPGQAVNLRYDSGIWHVIDHSLTVAGLDGRYLVREKSTGISRFRDSNGAFALGFGETPNATNHAYLTSSVGSDPVVLSAEGLEENVNLGLRSKNAGFIALYPGQVAAAVFRRTTGGSNYLAFRSSTANNAIPIQAEGSGNPIGIDLQPKGSGTVTVNGTAVELTSRKDQANGYAGLNGSNQLTKDTTGNAATATTATTATKLVTARTISGVPFDGSANITVNNGEWRPADVGYIAWAFDPMLITASSVVTGGGALLLVGVQIPATTTVTNVHILVATAETVPVTGQSFAALYQGGTLKAASSTSLEGVINSTGHKTIALSSPQTVNQGLAYVGFFYQFGGGGGTLALGRAAIGGSASLYFNNGPLSDPNLRFAYADTGRTTSMPATYTTQTATIAPFWAAVS